MQKQRLYDILFITKERVILYGKQCNSAVIRAGRHGTSFLGTNWKNYSEKQIEEAD